MKKVKTIPDDPELDCTDAAHPAWWRGHHKGCLDTARAFERVLDGKFKGTFGAPELERVRRRIVGLIAKLNVARGNFPKWAKGHSSVIYSDDFNTKKK